MITCLILTKPREVFQFLLSFNLKDTIIASSRTKMSRGTSFS